MTILNQVKTYLEKHRGHWPQIFIEAGVSYSWGTKIVQGKIKNPGIGELQKLINYIDAHPDGPKE